MTDETKEEIKKLEAAKKRYESLRSDEIRDCLPGIVADAETEIEKIDEQIARLQAEDEKVEGTGSDGKEKEDRSFKIGDADNNGYGCWFVEFDPVRRTAEMYEERFSPEGVTHDDLCMYSFDEKKLHVYSYKGGVKHIYADAEKDILDLVEKMKEFLKATGEI